MIAIKCLVVLLISVMSMIQHVISQHYENFVSGIVLIDPISYAQTNADRNFTILSTTSIIANSSLVLSPLSFNYFSNNLSCFQAQKNQSVITVTCSPNVYKLGYLLIEKGPNIVILYSERVYTNRDMLFDLVDISGWIKQIKYPLDSLVKDDNTQYEINLYNFISTIAIFNDKSTNNLGPGRIKLNTVYMNVSLTSQLQLSAPMTVNITSSMNIQKIGFFSLVVIREMISLNLQIETYKLSDTQGQMSIGYFSGLAELSFYLANNTIDAYNKVSLNTQYNSTISTTNYTIKSPTGTLQTYGLDGFYQDKIINYSAGAGVNIKFNIVKDYYYLRCNLSKVVKYKQVKMLTEGKYYKLVHMLNTTLAMDVGVNGTLVLSSSPSNNTILTQLFYINSLGSNRYRLFNAKTMTPLTYNRTSQTYSLNYSWSTNRSYINDTLWTVNYEVNVSSVPYVIMSLQGPQNMEVMYLSVDNGTVQEGKRLILKSISGNTNNTLANNTLLLNNTFNWIFVEVDDSTLTAATSINLSTIQTDLTDDDELSATNQSNASKLGQNVMYFVSQSTFVNDSYNNPLSWKRYEYFSMQQGKCYDNNELLTNSTNSEVYYFDAASIQPRDTVQLNSNLSIANTSTLLFAQGYTYGVLLNKTSVANYFTDLNQGYSSRFYVHNYNTQYQLYISYNNSNDNINTSNNNNNGNTSSQMIAVINGCQQMKPYSYGDGYECKKCINNYIMYQPILETNNNSNRNNNQLPHQCYCPAGQFMTPNGQCKSCSSQGLKCLPPINIQAAIISSTKQSSVYSIDQLSKSISIKVSIQSTPQTTFSLMTPMENLLSKMAVIINNNQYVPSLNSISRCQSVGTSFCIKFNISNVTKSNYYNVRVVSIDGDGTTTNGSGSTDGYLLVNQSPQTSSSMAQSAFNYLHSFRRLLQNVGIITSSSSQSVYFVKFQTHPTVINQPSSIQTMVQNIQPVISTLNTSSSFILLAAPFLFDKFNLFSILQTNSILYMVSFFQFPYNGNSSNNNVLSLVREMFIFRNEPFFKLFYIKSIGNSSNSQQQSPGWIGIESYINSFQQSFLYNSSAYDQLSYPQSLYSVAIPSLNINQQSQNYLTLTLNSLSLILAQIILMQLFMKLVLLTCSSSKQRKLYQGKQIFTRKKTVIDLRRHHLVSGIENSRKDGLLKNDELLLSGKQNLTMLSEYEIFTQKRIQWQQMPELKDCIRSTLQQEKHEIKIQQTNNKNKNKTPNTADKPQLQLHQMEQIKQKQKDISTQITIKEQILFIVQGARQKKKIFYCSFVMIQIISQSYLLYFELIKPFQSSSQQMSLSMTVLNYVDTCFGLVLMFIIIVFPVFLINYYPLHLLKIVQVTSKLGAYRKMEPQNKDEGYRDNDFWKHSYTYEEIYFHFCIIYYQIILIPFAVAIGNDIFWQSLPILLYQLFKLVWLYKRLKILDKLKIFSMCLVFSTIVVWSFMPYNDFTQSLFQNIVIWSLYLVLFIEAAKLLKFSIVSVMNFLKTKKQQKSANDSNKSNKKIDAKTQQSCKSLKMPKQVQIIGLQEYHSTLNENMNIEKINLDVNNQKQRIVKFKSIKQQQNEQLKEEKVQKPINNKNLEEQSRVRRKIKLNKTNILTKMDQDLEYEQPAKGITTKFNSTRKILK